MRSLFWRFKIGCRFVLLCCLAFQRDSGAGLVSTWGIGPSLQPWNATNIVQIAAGSSHLLARRADGTLIAWGDNSYGATSISPGLSNVVDIAAGSSFNLALLTDGTLSGWGDNTYGALNFPASLSNVASVYAREFHALALCAGGRPVAWGYNGYGEGSVPADLTNLTSLAAGYFHNIALKADGTIVAWGNNNAGQTNCPAWLSNVTSVAAGAQFSMALTSSGRVIAWGDNSFHQTNVPAGLSNVVAIAAGIYHALALRSDATVVAWGEYSAGETNIPAQLSDVTAVGAGDYYSAALTEFGPVEIVQNPASLQIPHGSSTVLQVAASGSLPFTYQWLFNGQALTNSAAYAGVTNATLTVSNAQFSQQGTYTVLVQNPMSLVQSAAAQLGVLGVAELTLEPGDWTMGAGDNATFVAAAMGTPPLNYQWFFNGLALAGATNTTLTLTDAQPSASGTYVIVVTNPYGETNQQLTLTVTNRPPVNPNIYAQSIGSSPFIPLGYPVQFTCAAIGTEPLAFQWSLNGAPLAGQINRALNISQMTPERSGYYSAVVSNALGSLETQEAEAWAIGVFPWKPLGTIWSFIPRPPDPLTNASLVAVGDYHIAASLDDGRLVVWPLSAVGPAVTNVPYGPGRIVGLSAGYDFSLALVGNGTVRGWGYGAGLQIPTNLNGVIQVAAGGSHAAALRTNGAVSIWGFGYGSATNHVSQITNAVSIAVGRYHGMALLDDGTVTVWGQATNLAGLSNVVSIAAGEGTCLALRRDGTVVGWNSASARPPAGLSNVVQLAAGAQNNLALHSDGTVKDWGYPSWHPPIAGQLSNVVGLASGEVFHSAKIGNGSPAFTLQPRRQSRALGDEVALLGFVAGSQPLTYQWYRNGTLLSGRTNTLLTLPNVSRADIGDYTLVALNAHGAVTSAVAFLSIPAPPAQEFTSVSFSPVAGFRFVSANSDGSPISTQSLAGIEIEVTSNLVDWVPLPASLNLSNGLLQVTDQSSTNSPRRFYRLIQHW